MVFVAEVVGLNFVIGDVVVASRGASAEIGAEYDY